jgi:hypothetical protein
MKMFNFTVQKPNNSVLFLFLFVFFILSSFVQTYAQKITVITPSFELPDTGKVKGFDGLCSDPSWTVLVDIPGWSVDSPDLTQRDSGVEEDSPTDGTYRGFLMGGDSAIYQTLNRRVLEGDNIVLTVDASNIWAAPSFKMQLYYMNESSERVPIITEVKTLASSMTPYSIFFKASEHQEAMGYQIGILLDNVSDSASWIGIDNVSLINDNPGVIEIANYSFEEPDSNKIKGWDGVCSNPDWTNLVDIPGWQSDEDALDSGVEQQWTPTDGVYTAFLMGVDAGTYNITDYTIKENDQFMLTLDARDIYASNYLQIELFYVNDNNERVTMETSDDDISGSEMYEHVLTANASTYPNSVGHKIGVWIDNVSSSDQSWLAIDNIRLFNLKTTDVVKTETRPNRFALEQNYPNPFNPSTKISFSIKEAGFVKLNVYNLLGQHVCTIVNENLNIGTYERSFNASELPSGIYFYRLEAGNNVLINKMMLLK